MPGMDALAIAKWSAKLLEVFSAKLRFAEMCNREYEGDVKVNGSVKIFMPGEVAVAAYVRDTTTISYQRVTPGEQVMKITQRDYFALKNDDLEKLLAFAGGAMWERTIQRGAFQLAKTVDSYISGTVFANAVPTANVLAPRTLGQGAAANAYELLVDMARTLRDNDVPMFDVSVAVPPAFGALLHKDDRFTSFNTADARRTIKGEPIGMVEEMKVLETTNAPVSGSTYSIYAASKEACTYAEQLSDIEELPRDKDDFENRMRSQLVFDAQVVQPKALVKCNVQFAS